MSGLPIVYIIMIHFTYSTACHIGIFVGPTHIFLNEIAMDFSQNISSILDKWFVIYVFLGIEFGPLVIKSADVVFEILPFRQFIFPRSFLLLNFYDSTHDLCQRRDSSSCN